MSTMSSVRDAVLQFNQGRDPERLAIKLAKMRQHPFLFLRGTCHLFYESLPYLSVLQKAPLAWSCGDLHFENFGSYKGDNRLVYFDVNDFDEAILAPCSWDLLRLLTSLRCGADAMNVSAGQALQVSRECLQGYRMALTQGKPLWVEEETATGLVQDLFGALRKRDRRTFLDRRTIKKGSHRHLKVDGVKALPVNDKDRAGVEAFMMSFASTQPNPEFYRVLDVARRIAGTGSLGVARFVILIEGKGSPDGHYLLDLKEARPSALKDPLLKAGIPVAPWKDEAIRVATVQSRMQAVNHAFLHPVVLDGLPCLLKGLQPSEDRVAMSDGGRNPERLREAAVAMGRVLAWDHLRSSGRAGSAMADDLIAFGQDGLWNDELLAAVDDRVDLTRRQWISFVDENNS